MPSKIVSKGNIHKGDYLRTLLTDTLPGDVPIAVSNDGLYQNAKFPLTDGSPLARFIQSILRPDSPFTIPYEYDIQRLGKSPRRLHLLHPSSQLKIAEFYKEYDGLICYHCQKSEASLRSPHKIASIYFIKSALTESNKIKKQTIDTLELDRTVANPASYFSYRGHNREYKFFNSTEYFRLEKKYSFMITMDVANCFASIYTHSLFWATNDIDTAKNNKNAKTFGSTFDALMSSCNYNETNGICVGPEVSRIFAEIILSEVDRRVIKILKKNYGLIFRRHYEFRRYVDDFYIFGVSEREAKITLSSIQKELATFKLYANDSKTRTFSRPFVTSKTRIIRDSGNALQRFTDKFIDKFDFGGVSLIKPKLIKKPNSLLRSFLEEIKIICSDTIDGYNDAANYLIGCLSNRIFDLTTSYISAGSEQLPQNDYYHRAFSLVLEAIYFLYSVSPSVNSSLKVAQSAILSHVFFKDYIADHCQYINELIIKLTIDFINSFSDMHDETNSGCIPLECINLLFVLGEVGKDDGLARKAAINSCSDVDRMGYFEIVSYLYCFKNSSDCVQLNDALFDRACELVRGKDKIKLEAQAAHLALDILSCPYIDTAKRAQLFLDLSRDNELPAISLPEATTAVEAMETAPWFVDWREISLWRLIQKKELSAVY